MAGKGPMRLLHAPPGGGDTHEGLFLLRAEAPGLDPVERARVAADWGEATLCALDAGECETRCGLPASATEAVEGAFASLPASELSRRLKGEGGLKHTEDTRRNPRCARGHPLFSRNHPWMAGLRTTRCTVCVEEVAVASVRFHCVSKLCVGAQVCVRCAARFGPEIATALLLSSTGRRALLPSLGRAVDALAERLQGPGGAARAVTLTAELSRPLPLTRALVAWSGVADDAVDPLLAAYDEAHNTDSYRAAGRMQAMRLSNVVRELQRRLRSVERALSALEKRKRGEDRYATEEDESG